MKVGLTVKLFGEGEAFTMVSDTAQVRPVDCARRWRCAFPTRDCPIDPRLMASVVVAVDGLEIGEADFSEADNDVLVLGGEWPSAIAATSYA